jgi:hypothetical protein
MSRTAVLAFFIAALLPGCSSLPTWEDRAALSDIQEKPRIGEMSPFPEEYRVAGSERLVLQDYMGIRGFGHVQVVIFWARGKEFTAFWGQGATPRETARLFLEISARIREFSVREETCVCGKDGSGRNLCVGVVGMRIAGVWDPPDLEVGRGLLDAITKRMGKTAAPKKVAPPTDR